MREITVDFLREEIGRLGGLVTGTRLLHHLGPKLHGPAEAITPAHVQVLNDLLVTRLILLEPGEDERAAQRTLGVERVERPELLPGDVLTEEVPPYPAGAVIQAADVARLAGAGPVAIRSRGLKIAEQKVTQYLASHPPPVRSPLVTDSRVTRMTSAAPVRVRPLLAPRARALVVAGEDLLRSLLSNSLSTAGHEVSEASPADAIATARKSRFDVVVVDQLHAMGLLASLRNLDPVRFALVLACVDDPKSPEAARLLASGVNDLVPKPPRREMLLEKVRAGMECLGRQVRLAPVVKPERRTTARERGNAECSLRDALEGRPGSVPSARVVDTSPLGVRIEYPVPEGGSPCPYMPHAVHPAHALYRYARSNPAGRDLTVVLSVTAGKPKEVFARVAWVKWTGLMEQAGLSFSRPRGSIYIETSSRPMAGR